MSAPLKSTTVARCLEVLNLVVASLACLLGLSTLLIVAYFGRVRPIEADELWGSPVAMLLIMTLPILIALFVVPFCWERWVKGSTLSDLGLLPRGIYGKRMVLAAMGVGAAVTLWFLLRERRVVPVAHFASVAFGEEFLCRGVAQRRLAPVLGRWGSVIVAALIFAVLLHSNLPLSDNLILRFPIGLILGAVVSLTGSLWPAVVLHYAYDLAMIG